MQRAIIVAGVIEFFCGIGGLASCLPPGCQSTGIEINQSAIDIYKLNFDHALHCKTIESLLAADLQAIAPNSELWWMSPPCQPHTVQGLKRDIDDTRSAAILNLIQLIEQLRPKQIALENVAGFEGSHSFGLMQEMLDRCEYAYQFIELCPTQLGSNNRRPRFYLLASLEKLPEWRIIGGVEGEWPPRPLEPKLEKVGESDSLRVDDLTMKKYSEVIHIVPEREFMCGSVQTKCFTSAYGRSPVRSGSYLEDRFGVRRFSPREILWQLDFPREYVLPDWPEKRLWPLVGNTLALRSIRYLLTHLRLGQ